VVHRVVLDVELADAEALGQPVGLHERREARVEARARLTLDREQRSITPDAARPAGDALARDDLGDSLVVPMDFERTHALAADPERARGIDRVANVTTEAEVRHG
jgi:hypothetical protein